MSPDTPPSRPFADQPVLSQDWIRLSSSTVDRVKYDPTTQQMRVVFASGKEYTYGGVPPSEYEALIGSSSPGNYIRVIAGQYSGQQTA